VQDDRLIQKTWGSKGLGNICSEFSITL